MDASHTESVGCQRPEEAYVHTTMESKSNVKKETNNADDQQNKDKRVA